MPMPSELLGRHVKRFFVRHCNLKEIRADGIRAARASFVLRSAGILPAVARASRPPPDSRRDGSATRAKASKKPPLAQPTEVHPCFVIKRDPPADRTRIENTPQFPQHRLVLRMFRSRCVRRR